MPQDRRVYAFGINRKHLAVQIERGLGIGSNSVEIANVFSCCLDVIWRIGRAQPFMPSNSGHRFERLERIESSDPLLAAVGIRLTYMKMNIVVERIAPNGKCHGKSVEAAWGIGIRMPRREPYQ